MPTLSPQFDRQKLLDYLDLPKGTKFKVQPASNGRPIVLTIGSNGSTLKYHVFHAGDSFRLVDAALSHQEPQMVGRSKSTVPLQILPATELVTTPEPITTEEEIEHILDHNTGMGAIITALTAYVRTKTEISQRLELCEPFLFILDRIRSARNPAREADCLAIAAQLDSVTDPCLAHVAKRRHCTTSAISKRVNWWIDKLHLPRPKHLKSERSRNVYRRARLVNHWRRKKEGAE